MHIKFRTILKHLLAAAAVACADVPSYADGTAPRNVHETVWNGQFAPNSPETVSMLSYGDEHSSFYNGQVNQSIPVYTWKDNLFEIPISLCYSYSGLKPGFTESSVGLGWFLNASGVITREVRGIPDESWDVTFPAAFHLRSMYSDGLNDPEEDSGADSGVGDFLGSSVFTEPGSPYGGWTMCGFLGFYNGDFDSSILTPESGSAAFIYSGALADEYTVGMKCPAHLGATRSVESQPDVFHFSFMGHSGSFILQPDHRVLILNSSSPAGELNIDFVCDTFTSGGGSYFVITTGDNVRYTFAARVSSRSVELLNGSDMGGEGESLSSWKLTEILHPSGHRVAFNYEDCIVNNYSASKSRDHLSVDNGHGVGSGYIPVNSWQDPESYSESSLSMVSVHEKRLTDIMIEGRGRISFSYPDGLLSTIQVLTEGIGGSPSRLLREADLSYYIPHSLSSSNSRCSGVAFLERIHLSGVGTYVFQYDSADEQHRFPDSPDLQQLYCTDWYGYYNGSSYASAYSLQSLSVHDLAQRVFTCRNSHSLSHARMGAMTRITYPTGGYSTFEYESNNYGRISGLSTTVTGGNTVTAGLRIGKIRTFDTDGTEVMERRMSYKLEDGRSSGVLLQPITLEDIYFSYEYENRYGTLELRARREACSPLLDVGYTKDFHVEYLRVVEDVLDGASNAVVARTEHRFRSSSPFIEDLGSITESLSSSSRFEEEMSDVFTISRTSGPVLDWRMYGCSVLAGTETFTKEHSLTSGASSLETMTEYSSYVLDSTLIQRPFHGLAMLGGRIYEREYAPRLPYMSKVTTTLTEGTGSPMVNETEVSVNNFGQIEKVKEKADGGEYMNTYYTYSSVAPALITSLTRRRDGTLVSKMDFSYMSLDASHQSCLVPHVCTEHGYDGQGRECGARASLTFGSYDSWCNPGTVTDASGRSSAWTWGYSGLHPLSCTVADGRTTSWTWIPAVGVTKVTDPSGVKRLYDYDEYGRLVRKRNNGGEVLEEYSYNIVSDPTASVSVPFSTSENFVSTRRYVAVNLSSQDVQYYDGLGRESQHISMDSGDGMSSVTQTVRDPLGRVVREYLPFAHTTLGAYVSNWGSALRDYYCTDGSVTSDEPLYMSSSHEGRLSGRILSRSLPGRPMSTHPALLSYRTNSAGEVRRYSYSSSDGSISVTGSYSAGELSVIRSEDGDSHVEEVFTDREGREVCTKKYLSSSESACTYKVYDRAGRLAWVISPEGYESIGASSVSPSDDAARKWCYIYTYDEWGRMTSKSLPGRDVMYMVYDRAGRVVLSQDGNQRTAGKWLLTQYNAYDEVTGRSLLSLDEGREHLQAMFPADGNSTFNASHYVVEQLESHQYGSSSSTASIPSGLSFSVEDGVVGFVPVDSGRARLIYDESSIIGGSSSQRPPFDLVSVADLTASPDAIRPITPASPTKVKRAYYYDSEGRVVQTVEKNHLGGISRMSFRYDRAGNVVESVERHTTSETDAAQDVKHSLFQYDNRGRLVAECSSVNNGEVSLVSHEYNGIGQLRENLFGDEEYGIRQSFSYTLQGWQASSRAYDYNDRTLFGETLSYDSPAVGTPLYTGNISCVSTTRTGEPTRTRSFSYDALGRLTSSAGPGGPAERNAFTEQGISYDLNGSILSLRRYGADGSLPEDDFTYNYDGGKLVELVDQAGESMLFDYDANGNQTYDGLRDWTISYNCLNLPESVTEGGAILGTSYTYTTDGVKRAVTPAIGTGCAYLGTMVFAKEAFGSGYSLESCGFSGGRFVPDGSSTAVRYYITDHLGSTRCIAHGEEGDGSTIYEQNDYYPFGTRISTGDSDITSPLNRWRFSGKEEQSLTDETILDFGARYYDSCLARWTTQDPLAEKYYDSTPYNYCAGNPVMYVDPDGRYIDIVYSTSSGNKSFRFTGNNKNIPNNPFVKEVISMYEYNKSNWKNTNQGGICPSTLLVESTEIGLYVYKGNTGVAEYSRLNGGVPYIQIDPYAGTLTDNGTILSPATKFAHEADHAIDDLTDHYAHINRQSIKDDSYDNLEEKRVITCTEQKMAKANGEMSGMETRLNHNGKVVYTLGPTSNKIDPVATRYFYMHKNKVK